MMGSRRASSSKTTRSAAAAEPHSIVASVKSKVPHPDSSLTLSPDRRHAIAAGKDTLRLISVASDGLHELKSLRFSKVRFFDVLYQNRAF